MSLKKFNHQTSIPHLWKTCLTVIKVHYYIIIIIIIMIFCVPFFKYTIQMLVMTSSKFCETSTDNVPLLVYVIQCAFIIPFNP